MKEFDETGLKLCNAQSSLFYDSAELFKGSSKVFVRCFMNSSQCAIVDRYTIFDRVQIINELNEKYDLNRGRIIYGREIMNWIGYLYRYWSYVYKLPSKHIYRIIATDELAGLYYAYHSLDPKSAIERIYEAKSLPKQKDALTVMKHIYDL